MAYLDKFKNISKRSGVPLLELSKQEQMIQILSSNYSFTKGYPSTCLAVGCEHLSLN